jgi:uncharacterized protein (DUF433 family)
VRPQDTPAYRASEAAQILALPAGTVRAWCFGHDYRHRADGSPKRFRPVIEPADLDRRLLSFVNLCELHLLAVIRRHHKVTLPKVRAALDYLGQVLGVQHPLASQRFMTNGVSLFVEHAGQLLDVSQRGQQALRADFERALSRIEFDRSTGSPVLLYPYTRPMADGGEAPRSVLVDPARSFGRPVFATALVRTEVIGQRFAAGDGITEVAADYGVSPEDIEEALRFEHRHAA